jgi:hypothetical protein
VADSTFVSACISVVKAAAVKRGRAAVPAGMEAAEVAARAEMAVAEAQSAEKGGGGGIGSGMQQL